MQAYVPFLRLLHCTSNNFLSLPRNFEGFLLRWQVISENKVMNFRHFACRGKPREEEIYEWLSAVCYK